ncbi:hypothetical protein GIB67_005636 [Kingdonia uniflora]|uniref:Uncharacterized protein n=1 Tax=Kingdonia uniflora TaxID=39325 RepID=A0A7J7NIC8_9MAGN|nr:hypothetical protein GIB67_005636 [Kingdonia uniflora]
MLNYISVVGLYLTLSSFYPGISCKASRKESLIDVAAREGTELEAVLKELEISRFKRVASKDDKVRRSQAKRRMAGKTPSSMEEKLVTPELNIPLKLARLNKISDGPVDMATASSTVVRNLAKRKAVKRGAASRSVTSHSVGDSSKRRKVTSPTKSQVVLEESDKIVEGADLRPRFKGEAEFSRTMRGVQLGFQDRLIELEKKISQLEGEKNQFEENLTREREAFQLELEKEREVVALKLKEVRAERKLYQLRYTKAEIMAFSEENYEGKEIMDEEEVEEMEDDLNIAEKTVAGNQETIDQVIESSRHRVVDLEGLLEVEKKSSAELQVSLNLEEAKSQDEHMTATILSRDMALNQLTSELADLKEKAASGSWHEAELAEYHIRVLNDEISDMKLDRLRVDLHRLKGREAQSRTNLAEIQANNKSLVDNLAHASGNMRRVVQCDKELNERINQLCARISELEWELRVREMKYQKDLKFELDKRYGEIASGEGSRVMNEFLH